MRRLIWLGSTLDDLSRFPKEVKGVFGHALREVQKGTIPPGSIPLKQFGLGVYELRDSHGGDAYRGIYLIKLSHGVYVVHMFKKKSKVGRGMPNEIVATIVSRIKQAQAMDRELETP